MPDEQETEILQEEENPQIENPGQFEGRDKPVKHTPPEGSPRWEKIYAEAKEKGRVEAERDQLKELLKTKDDDISLMRQQFTEMVSLAKTQAESVAKAPPPSDPIEAELEKVNDKLGELKAARKQAASQVNLDLMAEIDEHIDALKDRKYELNLQKATKPKEEKKAKEEPPKQENKVHPVVLEIIEETPWMNINSKDYDPEMTAAATGLEQKLLRDPTWGKVSHRERLKEIVRRIEARYEVKPPRGLVEGTDSSTPSKKEPDKLTDDQKKTAKLFFPDLSEAEAYKEYSTGLRAVAARGRK